MATVIIPISDFTNRKISGFWNISLLARKCNLNFSKHEVLGSSLIGLDTIKRKLLFFKQKNHKAFCCIIDLKEVKTCTVRKIYNSIEAGELRRKKLEEYLNTISLYLRFKNGKNTIALPFYERNANPVYDIPELETKAKDWMSVLSKMLPPLIKERA